MLETAAHPYRLADKDLIFSERPDAPYTLRVRDLPDQQKPREKLIEQGAPALTMAELVAVLWGVGNRNEDVLAMARRTLKEYGEKPIAVELNPKKLSQATDIPLIKACQIVAGFELGRRFYATQAGRPVQIRTAKQAYQYLKEMERGTKEQLRGLYLNSRYQVIHDEVISIGSLTSNVVHPREVFQPAIERGGVAIIIAHNHPSGRTDPTTADIDITEQLINAGDVLGIELLDHLIITPGRYTSIMDCLDRGNRL